MSEAAAPVSEARRIKSLDVVRGFAVLGILAVNAIYFAAPWQAGYNPTLPPLAITDETAWSWFVMHVCFEFKCITLFSLLFGASLYMVGGERADHERGAILRRRLFWLLVFGVIHAALIWYGDILVTYALTGFLVLFVRSWSPRMLLTVGAALFCVALAFQALTGLAMAYAPAEFQEELRSIIWAPGAEELARQRGAYQGELIAGLRENITVWLQFLTSTLPSLMLRTAGVMMVGMGLFKLGFFSGTNGDSVYLIVLALGCAALALIGYQAWLNWRGGFDFLHMHGAGMVANSALSIVVSLGYASLLILLVKAGARWITEPLAAVGRMAFTNYIAQSLIMTTLFWGARGFGLWGEVDRVSLWSIVIAVWALQLIWSPLWLARFKLGPLEWLWRRLSYGRPVAMA